MTGSDPDPRAAAATALRAAGARFALVHGSRAAGGTPRPNSDLDVAAWWPAPAPAAFDVDLPPGVDLMVLNDAPLELAGRVALDGELLFDDDPPARVRWVATTRKIYSDELPRIRRAHREFVRGVGPAADNADALRLRRGVQERRHLMIELRWCTPRQTRHLSWAGTARGRNVVVEFGAYFPSPRPRCRTAAAPR